MMKRLLGSTVRIIGKNFENRRVGKKRMIHQGLLIMHDILREKIFSIL